MVMTVIKVTRGGCGIKYTDKHGNARHALKTPKDGAFECDVEQAKRLIDLGVAELVSPWTIPEGDAAQSDAQGTGGGEKNTGHLDAAALEEMDYNELKKLAADMGVVPEGKKKADYVAALVAVEVEADGEEETDGEEDPDNDMPELNAADPE